MPSQGMKHTTTLSSNVLSSLLGCYAKPDECTALIMWVAPDSVRYSWEFNWTTMNKDGGRKVL